MPMDLWLARHGETQWSLSGRHTGATDVALTPNGTRQARALGPLIGDHPFSRVLSSPLLRALETARVAGFADRVEVSDLLREYDYGTYEGRTTADIQLERPGWDLSGMDVPAARHPTRWPRAWGGSLRRWAGPRATVSCSATGTACGPRPASTRAPPSGP